MKKKIDAFDILNYVILFLLTIITIYPILNTAAISLNEGLDTMRGGITVFPRKFTLQNYAIIFKNKSILNSFGITVLRTLIGTVTSLLATSLLAYGLSKKNLKWKKLYTGICVVSMYFSGGLIPTYLLIYNIGLINNFWVYIIPNMISVFNVIIVMTFFKQIPEALEESAKLDGAGQFLILFRIILPVSMPMLATIALFNAVFQWNSWFDGYIYMTNDNLLPLQNILLRIINSNSMSETLSKAGSASAMVNKFKGVTVKSVNMATMMVSMIPIFMVYPFLQKYFVKGIMVGSIKG
ncbi:MAG: binding-protein-dependent transport system inner rane component [Eubacterium sp.]|nr:binding-protein-dependent transport system inner rane component [Eubacterium sp.]